jgi:hypothetical protein
MDSKFEEVFMKKTGKTGFLLLAAIAVLVLAGCPQEAEEYSGSVNLSSLRVGDVAARNLPTEPTPREDWEQAGFNPLTMDIAHVVFPPAAFEAGELKGVKVQAGVASGTEIWYVKAAGGLKPADDAEWTKDNTFDLKPNNSVYLQVTAADKKTQVYYRLQIHEVSPLNSIKALVIGNKNARVSDLDGDVTLAGVTLGGVNLAFGTENLNARIEVTKTDNGAEVQFLRVEAGASLNTEEFSALDVYNFDDGDTVYVKVTPSGDGAPQYYGAVVTSRRVSAANIGGINVPLPDAGAVSAETATPIPVSLTLSSQTTELSVVKRNAASIDYAYVPTGGTLVYAPLTEETEITYADNGVLYLKVKADGFKDLFYAFTVESKRDIAALDSAAINNGTATLPTAGTTWANAAAQIHAFGATPPVTVSIAAVVAEESRATVRYGISTTTAAPSTWSASGSFTTFNSGDYVGVEVTSENGLVIRYYKWRLSFGSADATLAVSPSLYIAGVPIASLGNPGTAYTAASGTTPNGTIYLNSTQGGIGKSVVVSVTDSNVTEVAMSTNNIGTSDTTAPTGWTIFTKNGTTTWTGAITTTAMTTTNRRFYIRVTAQDAVTQNFYRFQVTYSANYTVLNALTIGGVTVAAASRGTPAGSWNASDLVPGNYFIDTVPDPLAVTFTWQTGGTNATSYAVTPVFPPAAEPIWTTGTSPLSLTTVSAGNYIWIRGINNTNTSNSYRNIYVIKVGPPPFTATVAGQAVPYADLGTINATGNTNVGGNPTPMGKIFLTEAQMASVAVSTAVGIPGDTVKVISYKIPESGGTTINTTAQTSAFTSATGSGTFNLADTYPTRGLPVLQFQYTPQGSSTSTYYSLVARKTQDIPFATATPVIDGELDAAWTNAPEITIDRIGTDTTTAGLTAGTDRGKPAKIKVLWDNDALYYYARVYDSTIGTTATDHNSDSIEFFKKETWESTDTGNNWTGQYRINAAGVLTGDASASNTTRGFKLIQDGVADDEKGYVIEARITWSAAAATVAADWSTGGPDKEIGVEFQLAYSLASTRNIAMSWNNRFGANYQQCANAGRFVLKR